MALDLELQQALDLAHRHLDRRDRTEFELRRYLADKRVEPAVIDATLAALREARLVDDARYAQHFAEDRRTLDHWGAERIERRLLSAGVAPELIEAALAPTHEDDPSELERALGLLRRRMPAPPRDDRDRSRALGLLVRRGYDSEVAYEAIAAFERS